LNSGKQAVAEKKETLLVKHGRTQYRRRLSRTAAAVTLVNLRAIEAVGAITTYMYM